MHVAGIVVRSRRGDLEELARILGGRPGVEVHQISHERAALVVTLETPDLETQVDRTRALLSVPRVTDVEVVYHAFEEEEPS